MTTNRIFNVTLHKDTEKITYAEGMKFWEDEDFEPVKHALVEKKCNCTNNQLMWGGCICGGT